MTFPTHLYHYTTIESLALILKHRTIRFSSISNLDDLTECQTDDSDAIAHSLLVSCWTEDSFENIALWTMYSKSGVGCRIKMPINLFYDSKLESQDFYVLPDNNLLWYPQNNPKKIEYVDLKPSQRLVAEQSDGPDLLNLSSIGTIKTNIWKFQREYRYIIFQVENFPTMKQKGIGVNLYDVTINPKVFQEMEILVGPEAKESEMIIVKALVSQFNPTANIKKSELSGKIRLS